MSARTARTRLFAASTVALAALALTACESGSDTGAGSPASSTTATAEAKPSTGGSADAAGGAGANASNGTGGTGGTGGQGDAAGSSGTGGNKENGTGSGAATQDKGVPGKCSASAVKITATEVSRPLNHLLLTATNTGAKTCSLPAYPQARFGEAQSVPPVAEETKPQAVTTLEPGKSGYAGVLLSAGDGSAGNGRTVNTLTVPFDDGSIATVRLPSGGVHVDDALTVTYWQTSVDHALSH